MKTASVFLKDDDFDNVIRFLKQAADIKPNDLVVNYRLAVSFERIGAGKDAIQYYKEALKDPFINSSQIKRFIMSQIERVATEGPKKKPPMFGFRYMTW